MFLNQTTIQVNGEFKRSFFTPLISLILSTLLLTSCSDPDSSGGVTLSKTEDSSIREAFPNTYHDKRGDRPADRNVQHAAKLKVTSPNKGEKWAVGTVQKIEWNKGSKGSHVIIKVYKSKKYIETITRKTKNDGSHSWKIPSSFKTGATFSIKVTSFTYHNACATFYDYLTYSPGSGRALVSIKTDTHQAMCIASGGAAARDKCRNDCASKFGSKNCEVVDVDGNNCTSTASAYDVSDNFTITKASGGGGSSLKVSTPNGGESWATGKTQSIKWSKGTAGANVKIELLKSGKKSLTISKKTKNDGKHSWKIPSTVKAGSKYKIKITSSTKKTVTDSSDSNFTITKAGGGGDSSLKVSTPNGGESWTTGKSYDLKWSKGTAGANVKIELLKSGKKSLTISKKTKNDGKHKWKVPSSVKTGSKYKIKITSSTKKTVSDSSDSNFTITKAEADTCTMKVRVGDSSVTTYHPGKKVCLGKTSTDVVCGTTGGAGPNYWATIKKVPKKSLNIYPCGSKNKYPVHGVDASYCGGTFEIHPWGFGNDYEAKCGF